jgi:hypothetical protein
MAAVLMENPVLNSAFSDLARHFHVRHFAFRARREVETGG